MQLDHQHWSLPWAPATSEWLPHNLPQVYPNVLYAVGVMPNKAARNPSRVSALLMAGSEALPLLDPVVMRNEQKSSNERDGYPGDARPPHSHPI